MAVLRTLYIWAIRNTKKYCANICPMICFHTLPLLWIFILIIIISFYLFCLILKTAITVKYLFLHGRQPSSLLKWKRVYYYWKATTFKEIFPREQKIPCLNWGRITLTKPNNPINDCAPFLVPRSSLYYKKEKKKKKKKNEKKREKKKNKMWPIQPWPKNWQCGMKIKGGINSKENRDPFKVY